MVAQINEQQLAVIALSVHPARQPGGNAGLAKAERATVMGAIGVHQKHPGQGKARGEHGTDRSRLSRNPPI
jgi:hypothetical protein